MSISRPCCSRPVLSWRLLAGFVPSLFLLSAAGCRHHHSRTIVVTTQGVIASDLLSVADYLALAETQAIFQRMPRNPGGSPPTLVGRYESGNQTIAFSTIPGERSGEVLPASVFCFGEASGGALDALILEDTLVDVGAGFFLEGSGDRFTAYLAHKSLQQGGSGRQCEIHLLRIISGERQVDGRLANLSVGIAVIGLVGDCDNLLVGDYRVSEGSGLRIAETCFCDPLFPDANDVLVDIRNDLKTAIDVRLTDFEGEQFVTVEPESFCGVQAHPGFQLSFQSLQPEAPGGIFLGDILFKDFDVDPALAGEMVTYRITHDIDGNLFFFPLVENLSSSSLLPLVNFGIPDDPDGAFYDFFIGPGQIAELGYHPYDFVGVDGFGNTFHWQPQDANLRFFLSRADVPQQFFLEVTDIILPPCDPFVDPQFCNGEYAFEIVD